MRVLTSPNHWWIQFQQDAGWRRVLEKEVGKAAENGCWQVYLVSASPPRSLSVSWPHAPPHAPCQDALPHSRPRSHRAERSWTETMSQNKSDSFGPLAHVFCQRWKIHKSLLQEVMMPKRHLPNVATLNIFFHFPLLICLFYWLTENGWLNLTWDPGCDLPCLITIPWQAL